MPKNTLIRDHLVVDGLSLRVHPGAVKASWTEAARAKGYRIAARIRDRMHVALLCRTCGALSVARISVLVNNRPVCPTCLTAQRQRLARQAGLTYLGPDPDSTLYGRYQAGCGHEQRRQFGYVQRMAAGTAGLRCEICFAEAEAAIAVRRGWRRVGSDPQGNPNYHMYRHECGHRQRIARGNLGWGQVDCAGCGQCWSARASRIYLFDLRHGDRHLLKLGYSAHPKKRLRHQLGLPKDAQVRILREVAMPTGHAARVAEAVLHRDLRRNFPAGVVPSEEYRGFLNVTSEIYRPGLLAEITARLDALETGGEPGSLDAVG